MRLFFALPVPDPLKLQIAKWRDKALPPMARFVPIANLHITLCFLGEVAHRDLDTLCQLTDQLFSENAFNHQQLRVEQTGYWPKPGILWVGPSTWPEELNQLVKKLKGIGNQLSTKNGHRRSKENYQAHITLARNCQLPCKPTHDPDFKMDFDEVVLFESIMKREGVQYEPVASWPLRRPRPGTSYRRSKTNIGVQKRSNREG